MESFSVFLRERFYYLFVEDLFSNNAARFAYTLKIEVSAFHNLGFGYESE